MDDNSKDFDTRLQSLKNKLSLKKPSSAFSESYGIKIVADLISGLIVGGILGYLTDKLFNTWPILFIIFMILGFFVGLYVFYKDLIVRDKAHKTSTKKN